MHDAERKFEGLIGRKPTAEELRTLQNIQKTLGIRDNDALWAVIIALQFYKSEIANVAASTTNTDKSIKLDLKWVTAITFAVATTLGVMIGWKAHQTGIQTGVQTGYRAGYITGQNTCTPTRQTNQQPPTPLTRPAPRGG